LDINEEQLLKKCQRHDLLAQKELYIRYRPLFSIIVRRYIVDPDDAKDVLQDSFLLIFKNIGMFRGDGSFEGWMKRIVINTSLQFLKSQKHRLMYLNIDDCELSESQEVSEYDIYIDKNDGHSLLSGIELVRQAELHENDLIAIIQTLPDDFRQVFNLYFIDNFSHAEIAQMLNIDEVTSRTRLVRAKKKVQTRLYKQCVDRLTV